MNERYQDTGEYPIHFLINHFSKNTMNARRILNILAENKADMNLKNDEGWAPIHIASM